ncbi:methyltransferase family protein [Actinobacillus vicugnae]|uniref:methyltransferase family protein n=1 Tax=Actinobacillus vicugnae TaxID=2573093 RepID=UPI00123F10D9|nr:isoprenylcysteine carboxylmethyltransferase family protein [Actinobacillus vicugnae]
MDHLELKLPPPLLFMICAGLIYLLPKAEHYPVPQWLSYPILFIGVAIAIASLYAFYQQSTTISPQNPEKTSVLVQRGIYRFSRNPMYLSLLFCLIAWLIWLNRYFGTLVIIGFVYYLNRFQIKPEERILKEKFGQTFVEYCAEVRRWL